MAEIVIPEAAKQAFREIFWPIMYPQHFARHPETGGLIPLDPAHASQSERERSQAGSREPDLA